MIKSRLYLDLSFQSFVSEMSKFEKNSINSYRLDNRYSIVNSKCINHLLVCLEDRISVFEFEIAKQGRQDDSTYISQHRGCKQRVIRGEYF